MVVYLRGGEFSGGRTRRLALSFMERGNLIRRPGAAPQTATGPEAIAHMDTAIAAYRRGADLLGSGHAGWRRHSWSGEIDRCPDAARVSRRQARRPIAHRVHLRGGDLLESVRSRMVCSSECFTVSPPVAK
jgi:hypothetical protein